MRCNLILFLFSTFFVFLTSCTTVRCPQKVWLKYATPEETGWSTSKLEKAREYYNQIGSAAVMVICDGAVVVAWGDIERRYMCHSIRKSYLSALFGIHVGKGNIDLKTTLSELDINDSPPLNKAEKNAKIVDLLTSRSGIYHDAANESDEMTKYRPKRGSHSPGEFYWYNNWGFNALGTIFKQKTGTTIFEEFKKRIASPLGMQDFQLELTNYQYEPERSIHPGYPFRMSARDMARFGLLYLRKGRWSNRQIIPENWIEESITNHTVFENPPFSYTGYGYMWWIRRLGDSIDEQFYTASGYGGHLINVLPNQNVVFVHRVDTYAEKTVDVKERLKLLNWPAPVSCTSCYERISRLISLS